MWRGRFLAPVTYACSRHAMPASSLVVCSTRLVSADPTRPGFAGPEAMARLAAGAQADGVFLMPPWSAADVAPLAAALGAEGLPLVGCSAGLASVALPEGKRLPYWAAPDDADERAAALRLADETLGPAQAVGAQWTLLGACKLVLKAPLEAFIRAFGERRWSPDGSGQPAIEPLLEAAREERKSDEERLMDAARWSLERLARVTERRRMTMAIAHGVGPWQFPSPRELDTLLSEFTGAPLCRAHLPGRLDVLEVLGLLTPERRQALARSPFVLATDAAALVDDLLPGLGPNPLTQPLRQAEDSCPALVVVAGRPDASAGEVRKAVAEMRRLSAPPAIA